MSGMRFRGENCDGETNLRRPAISLVGGRQLTTFFMSCDDYIKGLDDPTCRLQQRWNKTTKLVVWKYWRKGVVINKRLQIWPVKPSNEVGIDAVREGGWANELRNRRQNSVKRRAFH
jgi:hypothetical protein